MNKSTNFHNSKSSVRRFDAYGFVKLVKIAYSGSGADNKEVKNGKKFSRNVNDDDDDEDYEEVGHDKTKPRSRASSRHPVEGVYDWYSVSIPSIDPRDSVTIRYDLSLVQF